MTDKTIKEPVYRSFSLLTKKMSPSSMTLSEWIVFYAEHANRGLLKSTLDQMIWLRSIGKTDKHGSMVFEGDIVTKTGTDKFEVVLELALDPTVSFSDMEVIGNVYENEDMLSHTYRT